MHYVDSPVGVREEPGVLVRPAGKQFYDPDDGSLVGAWLFDEGLGLFVRDSSIYGNHGIVDGADWVPDGLDFVAGSSDNVSLDGFTVESDVLSICFWLNSTQIGVSKYLLDGDLTRFVLAWKTTTPEKIGLYDGSGWFYFGDAPDDGENHSIIYLLDSDKASLIVDGVQLGVTITIAPISWKSVTEVKVGGRYSATANYFDGTIHSMMMYNKILSEAERSVIVQAGMYRRTETYRIING